MSNQNSSLKRKVKRLARNERGAVAMIATMYIPFLMGLFTLAIDMSHIFWTRNRLQVAAEVAALAATVQLPDNSGCILVPDGTEPDVSPTAPTYTTACDRAKQYAAKNLPWATYQMVVASGDVQVGKWTNPPGCVSSESCFEPVTIGGDCVTAPQCNAVRVTTRFAGANNNPLILSFTHMFGFPSWDVSATAIAVYGLGQNGAAPTWNVILVQDITRSLAQSELNKMKTADQALLDCMHNNAAAGSKMGVTLFAGCSGSTCGTTPPLPTYQPKQDVSFYSAGSPGYDTVTNSIGAGNESSGIKLCNDSGETPGMPLCRYNGTYTGYSDSTSLTTPGSDNFAKGSGFGITTNQYYGMKSAFSQLCTSTSNGKCVYNDTPGSKHAMVIVSDGLPAASNCGDLNRNPPQPRCNGQNGTPNLEGDAQKKAQEAFDKGDIDVFTIFYSSASASSQNYIKGAEFMRSLRRGKGKDFDLTTPSTDDLNKFMAQICATQPHRLVW